jgi:hypothetical protein
MGAFFKKLFSLLLIPMLALTAASSMEPRSVSAKEAGGASGEAAASANFRVIGYYSGELFDEPLENLQADKLTHLMYAFIIPEEDGSCRPPENPEKLKAIVEKCHQAETKVFLSVGGWSGENGAPLVTVFEKLSGSEESRERFVESVAALIAEYDADGLDFDWEYPNSVSAVNYEKTVLLLKARLSGMGKELSVCVPGTADAANGGEYLDAITDRAAAAFDFIQLMCYDMHNSGQHSPIWYSETSIGYWLKRGIRPEKLVLGMPLYARPSWMQYRDLVKLDPANAWLDHAATQPSESWYNGLNTLREKTVIALQQTGGVMFFDINEDTRDETSVLSMVDETLAHIGKLTRQQVKSYIGMVINNEPLYFDPADGMGTPFLDENGRTLVPVRKLLETIGAELTYDQCACTVRAVRGETAVVIRIGQKVIAVNGEETAVDSKAVIIDGRTYLPARAVLEAFGYSLSWSDASKTIYVWD